MNTLSIPWNNTDVTDIKFIKFLLHTVNISDIEERIKISINKPQECSLERASKAMIECEIDLIFCVDPEIKLALAEDKNTETSSGYLSTIAFNIDNQVQGWNVYLDENIYYVSEDGIRYEKMTLDFIYLKLCEVCEQFKENVIVAYENDEGLINSFIRLYVYDEMNKRKRFIQRSDSDIAGTETTTDYISDICFYSLYEDITLADINIQLDSGTIMRAHKLILAARSDYFRTSLYNWDNNGTISVSHISDNTMVELLRYIYCNYIDALNISSFDELSKFADYFQLDDLTRILKLE